MGAFAGAVPAPPLRLSASPPVLDRFLPIRLWLQLFRLLLPLVVPVVVEEARRVRQSNWARREGSRKGIHCFPILGANQDGQGRARAKERRKEREKRSSSSVDLERDMRELRILDELEAVFQEQQLAGCGWMRSSTPAASLVGQVGSRLVSTEPRVKVKPPQVHAGTAMLICHRCVANDAPMPGPGYCVPYGVRGHETYEGTYVRGRVSRNGGSFRSIF